MRRIAAGAVMVIAWVLILAGASLFVDGFLPLRSQAPAFSWVEVAMGTVGCGIGLGLRWVARVVGGLTGGHEEEKDIPEPPAAMASMSD